MTLLLVEHDVSKNPKAIAKILKRSIFMLFKIINMYNFFFIFAL